MSLPKVEEDMKGTRVEFWIYGTDKCVATVLGVGAVPREGELISIRKDTWEVSAVTWAVDHAGKTDSELRANVILKPASSEDSAQ
jgi:hypothetical protein